MTIERDLRKKLLLCALLTLACCILALLPTPAYFRTPHVSDVTYNKNNGVFELPAGKTAFTIVQFADLHFGEDSDKDARSKHTMQTVLLAEPGTDLVVFSGDQVSGWLM